MHHSPVGVPQAKEGAAGNKFQVWCDALAVLGAATHAPLGDNQLQEQPVNSRGCT